MDGMGMLLKAAGFDPAEFQRFVSGLKEYLTKINDDVETLKKGQKFIIQEIERIDVARKESYENAGK